MERALALAARGRGQTSPNPLVGAVVVDGQGVIVGAGFHERAGSPHAEVHALRAAGEAARGATLYCTLEPCCHVGRTGPCVDAVIAAGIRRLVAATEDPNPLVSGRGFERLRAHGIEVEVGVGYDEAVRLNPAFRTFMRRGRPFVILKAAATADGRITRGPGQPRSITSELARRHAHRVRAEVDAIAVGSGTILADDPLLTAREVYRHRPLIRVVFDRRLQTPPTASLFSTCAAGPVVILTASGRAASPAADALRAVGGRVEATDGSIVGALARLASLGVRSVLVEGGARLHGAIWAAGVADYVQVYVACFSAGEGGLPVFGGQRVPLAALVEPHVEVLGPDTLLEGYVHGVD